MPRHALEKAGKRGERAVGGNGNPSMFFSSPSVTQDTLRRREQDLIERKNMENTVNLYLVLRA